MPKSWIGEQFIAEAEHIKKVQPSVYEHEYLGRVTGTGGEIFTNLHIRPVSDNEINAFDKIRRGVDFGYATDPFVYLEGHFDGHRLFIYREIYKTGLSNSKAIAMIKELGEKRQPIICDSAEPKSINEFREAGLPALGAKKGPDSIEYGIKFLQSLDEIIIDGKRCPNAAREFSHYETDRDKEGNPIARYPDKNNHTIDAARYAMEQDTNFKKGKIIKGTEIEFDVDTLLLSVGLIPENELSTKAGIDKDIRTNGLIVSESMETSIRGVFACGNVLHVHDLVDFVTEEAKRAGRSVAKYLRNELDYSNYLHVKNGKSIKYVIPQKINIQAIEDNLTMLMRVDNIYHNKKIVVKCDETVIAQFNRKHLAPSEMEKVIISKSIIEKVKGDLVVSLEDGE